MRCMRSCQRLWHCFGLPSFAVFLVVYVYDSVVVLVPYIACCITVQYMAAWSPWLPRHDLFGPHSLTAFIHHQLASPARPHSKILYPMQLTHTVTWYLQNGKSTHHSLIIVIWHNNIETRQSSAPHIVLSESTLHWSPPLTLHTCNAHTPHLWFIY